MPAAEGGCIFVSYRRQDSSHLAGRLYDRLADRFGEGQVFMDVDTIDLGVDFAERITRAVAGCTVLLAVIGPNWLTVTDERGRRRLDDPDDFVRLEIEAALARGVRVIPILAQDAVMPGRQDLPESLASLARRNALLVRHESFRVDAERLVAAIERVLAAAPGAGVIQQPISPVTKVREAGTSGSTEAVEDTVPARWPRKLMRRQSIALLGPRAAGKTTLATFLHSGEMPSGFRPTATLEQFTVQGTFLNSLLRLVSLIRSPSIKNLPHRLTILDTPGMAGETRELALRGLDTYGRRVKNVFYLVDVSQLPDRTYHDLAVNSARQIVRWDLGDRRKLLILTHADLDPAWERDDSDEISSREAVVNLRRELHAEDVIIGTQKDDSGTRELAYRVLQFLAR